MAEPFPAAKGTCLATRSFKMFGTKGMLLRLPVGRRRPRAALLRAAHLRAAHLRAAERLGARGAFGASMKCQHGLTWKPCENTIQEGVTRGRATQGVTLRAEESLTLIGPPVGHSTHNMAITHGSLTRGHSMVRIWIVP